MTSGRPSVPRSVAGWGTAAVAFVAAHSVLLALAVLAVVGLAVVDDYGVGRDDPGQRGIGQAAIAYALGDTETLRPPGPSHNRYYGVVFEVPLVLVERLLGLTDSRAIYLSRHLLTHLCFLAGGGGAAWLASRLFGSRWLALLALGLFVLHPRLYAHSFFNTKDIPFLVAFLGCLALIHRAWQRGGVGAYALCGVGVGVATNLRIMGGGLFVAVMVMRVVDWVRAGSRAERRQVGRTLGVFGLAGVLTLYAVSPYLWGNPLELLDAIAVLSQHPYRPSMLFQGEVIRWPDLPAHYIPTWLAITTPPGVLLLSLIGAAGVLWRTLTHPGEWLRNPTTRFEGLLVACVLLPVGAVIVLNANVYDGWRQMYFLYAPLCLLAVAGLRRLVGVCRWPALRAGVYGLAVAGLAGVVIEMVGLHPYQHLYFNWLVDRRTPEYLRGQYRMDSWWTAHREGLEYLLQRYPASPISLVRDHIHPDIMNRAILPKADRRRIIFADGVEEEEGDFHVTEHMSNPWDKSRDRSFVPIVYARQVYNNTIFTVSAIDPTVVDAATAERYRQLYRATTAGPPLLRSVFDLYLDGSTLSWVKAPCRPADMRGRFVVHVVPVDPAAAEVLRFDFFDYGVRLDGACLIRHPLPPYPIHALEVRLITPGKGRADHWHVDIGWSPAGVTATERVPDPVDAATAERYRQLYRATTAGRPLLRSAFDLYREGATLSWVKAPCHLADVQGRFTVDVIPVDPAAAAGRPGWRPGAGREILHFGFSDYGAYLDGTCLLRHPLPPYAIRALEVHMVAPGDIERLHVDIEWTPAGVTVTERVPDPVDAATVERYRQLYRATTAGPPLLRSAFDLYREGATLSWVKVPCRPADVQGRFVVYVVPVDPAAAAGRPGWRPGAGREILPFRFADYGASLDGRCLLRHPLPPYAIQTLEARLITLEGVDRWHVALAWSAAGVRTTDLLEARYRAVVAAPPVARSAFALYLEGRTLTYVKAGCQRADTQGRFFLEVFPRDRAVLAAARRSLGFAVLDFGFDWWRHAMPHVQQATRFADKCLATVRLPSYPLARLRTGQVAEAGGGWAVDVALPERSGAGRPLPGVPQ